MDDSYYVYCGDRGWWSKGGGYTSEFKDAKSFLHEDAVQFCIKRYGPYTGVVAVPVSETDAMRIIKP